MKKRKIAALLCVVMTATTLVTGCGGNSSEESTQGTVQMEEESVQEAESENGEATEAENGEVAEGEGAQKDDGRVMGKVTAVNGNEITISVLSMGERPKMPEGENGERPEMPKGENGERPEMPEGENGERPEMPKGENAERPEDRAKETGETKTIVIEDESIIVKFEDGQEAAGSLADIETESIVTLSYDENKTLTQVAIGLGGKK